MLEMDLLLRAAAIRHFAKLIDCEMSAPAQLAWTSICSVEGPQRARAIKDYLKPPWLLPPDPDLRLSPFSESALFWRHALTSLASLNYRLEGVGNVKTVKVFVAWKGDYIDVCKPSARQLRRALRRSTSALPCELKWQAELDPRAGEFADRNAARQGRWVHYPFRRPSQRYLHYLVIYGGLSVNARMYHSMRHLAATQDCMCLTLRGGGARETVVHLFNDCMVGRQVWELYDNVVNFILHHCQARGNPAERELTSLPLGYRVLAGLSRTPSACYDQPSAIALNLAQAAALEAIWETRNSARDDISLFTADRARRYFIRCYRSDMRRVGASLPSQMNVWVQCGLFKADKRTFFFESVS